SNPTPATMNDEGLADARSANPFALPRLHPGIGFCVVTPAEVTGRDRTTGPWTTSARGEYLLVNEWRTAVRGRCQFLISGLSTWALRGIAQTVRLASCRLARRAAPAGPLDRDASGRRKSP